MSKEQEEAILRITAHYVAALRAGRQPRVSDYLLRYPRYADAIADFVAYYHSVELPEMEALQATLPLDAYDRVPLSDVVPEAHEPVQLYQRKRKTATQPPLSSILEAAQARHISMSQLAERLDLSEDLLLLLEQRALEPLTLPHELLRRLARCLHLPIGSVRGYLSTLPCTPPPGTPEGQAAPVRRVAEGSGAYLDIPGRPDFRSALRASQHLTEAQRAIWEEVLARERR